MKKLWFIFIFSILFIYPTFSKFKYYDINNKYIALAFENNLNDSTINIINLLSESDYKATFFVSSKNALDNKKIINLINSKNNEIGNHTYINSDFNYTEILNEIDKTQKTLYQLIGKSPNLLKINNIKSNDILKQKTNINIITDFFKTKYTTNKNIASDIISNIEEDLIIIMDNNEENYKALQIIISKIKELNYNIVTISELMEIKNLREQFKY